MSNFGNKKGVAAMIAAYPFKSPDPIGFKNPL
jgi:hypothetical protein